MIKTMEINNESIELVKSIKYLCLTIDEHFKFNDHVNCNCWIAQLTF